MPPTPTPTAYRLHQVADAVRAAVAAVTAGDVTAALHRAKAAAGRLEATIAALEEERAARQSACPCCGRTHGGC
jgi:DNA repair exonuclease SbcCD ATPase subunit